MTQLFQPYVESNIRGEPYITVSAKGVNNGLSDIINDGADFGPDTPNTQTSGIQEAFDYSASSPIYYSVEGYYFYPVHLNSGLFYLNEPVIFKNPYSSGSVITIEGAGQWSTDILYSGTGNAITIDPNTTAITIRDLTLDNPSETANSMIYWDSSIGGTGSSLVVQNINNGEGSSSGYLMYFNNIAIIVIKNINTPSPHAFYINGLTSGSSYLYLEGQGVWSGTSSTIGNLSLAEISGVNQKIIVNNYIATLKLTNCYSLGVELDAQVDSLLINNSAIGTNGGNGPNLIVNTNINYINLTGNVISGSLISSTDTSNTYTINYLIIDGLRNTYIVSYFNNVSNIKIDAIELKNIAGGTFSSLPTQSSTDGTTAGTISMDAVEYRIEYKKYVITFNGYENDTTTNQTINYPLPFNTSAIITGNNTGLTVSITTTGITITAPNNTTTYSGIMIIEGY